MVSSADRQSFAAALTARFWIDVWPRGRALRRTRPRDPPASLSLDTAPPPLCRALSRGSGSARRTRAPGALDAGAEPFLDRAKLDGGRRKMIIWPFHCVV